MRVIQEDKHRINRKITSEELRLVGDNVEIGVYKLSQALAIANEQNLDLVEISPKAVPPVCKVMDYKKFLYEQKKREKALKSRAAKVVVKEIRLVQIQTTMTITLKKSMLKNSLTKELN